MNPRPVHFGPRGGLFGFWETPAGPPRGCVVLSGSAADEGLRAHWAFRRLSARLAGLGLAVLRVDLAGAGDSLDVPEAESLVEKWKWSLQQAADTARAWTHGAPLAFVGLRLSAALAAHAAAARDDVAALVLLDPAAQGRLWLREQRAQALAPGPGIGRPAIEELGDGGHAILGYPYSPRTQAELGALALSSLPRRPAPQVLVVEREGRELDGPALDALGREGLTRARSEAPGLEQLLLDDALPREPGADFARVAGWLDARFGPPADAHLPASKAAAHLEGDGFEEEAALGGGPRRLAAIACRPTRTAPKPASLVLVDTSLHHRVGAGRAAVHLARAAAKEGYPSLRFDVGGLGDSPAQFGQVQNHPYNPGNVDDVRVALDWLAERGARRFLLAGLGSGGYHAFHAALADARVAGLVLVNTQRFAPWSAGDPIVPARRKGERSVAQDLEAALDPETWRRVSRGEVDLRAAVPEVALRAARHGARRLGARLTRTFGPRVERDGVAKGFLALCARGVGLSFVLSADDGARDALEAHLGPDLAVLRGQPGVAVELLEGADHTLSARFARARLSEVISSRLGELAQ